MAEDKMMRLSQVARILNVGISTIVDHLSAKGFKVETNPNTKINAAQIEFLAKDFRSDELQSELKPRKPVEEVVVEKKEEKLRSEFDEILYFRTPPPKSTEKADEEQPAEKPVSSSESRLPGIKVVGKIDLRSGKPIVPTSTEVEAPPVEAAPKEVPAKDVPAEVKEEVPVAAKSTEKEIVKEEPVKSSKAEEVPAPVVPPVAEQRPEPPVPAPASEEAPTAAKEEVPVPEKAADRSPQVEVSVEAKAPEVPSVAKETPGKADEATEPAKEQKEQPAPVSASPQVPQPQEAAAPEKPAAEQPADGLIEAKGEQLRGLRVVGKIELPSDRNRKKDPVASSSDANADKKRRRKRKRIREGGTEVKADAAATPGATTTPKPKETGTGTGTPAAKPAPAAGTAANKDKAAPRGGRRRDRRDEVSEKEVSDNIKATMARMGGGTTRGGARGRGRRRDRSDQDDYNAGHEEGKVLRVTEFISANDLSSFMEVTVQEVISVCLNMGMFVSINQRLDAEAITFIADEFGYTVEFISAEEEVQNEVVEEVDDPNDLIERAPIVTIMGHVDHGKTSLLDYIREANVASGEAGGITQHIGAYSVKTKTGKLVTFLDTPGHEAFTAMRARGAKVTDVVIIVIAADDSVMPQTREAINHAQVAGVPIVFAFSKVDKAGANTEKIREELANMNLLVEDWGGKYQAQEISSKSGLGIDDLLEKVLLEAELLELKANPSRRASGTVVEAMLDKGRGYVTTILVQNGTLKMGDVVLAGANFGRVKAMTDYRGKRLKTAGPSTPVQLLGLSGAPQAGDKFNVMENERDARDIANKREQILREQNMRTRKHITLEEIGRRKAIGSFKELNLIVKGDVDGSVEALSDSLLQLSTGEIQVNIIHKAVGQISESDVNLAIASDAIIVGFQVRPSPNAKRMAEQDQIEIRHYSVIYRAIEEIKDAMTGMLAPTVEEFVTGNIEIREVFKISRIGTIAGCYVTDGFVKRNNKIRIIRDGIVIHMGEIDSLKRFKDDVNEVRSGYECGLNIKNFNEIEVGDIIESYELREVKRTL
ncbi:translation initiation factor IF-2 [Rhabdobacter roseus]|uniref:Translation initiation factor IF-2 n=1 Tax=Rhabdobacter roseus TaxID=1655419 RepID=A0A840TX48_9BACT|nr:translation initiation factor IF-2 [Rhabdobacter roseus]MBB5284219.1 translation initiation factor IF-2 [Rhabdobacter roseus]